MSKQSLNEAVKLAGGQVALANGIKARFPASKVSQAHVWKWLNRANCEVPPAEYVIAIAETINWQLRPHDLRPDIYPNPDDGLPTHSTIPPSIAPITCGAPDPRHAARRAEGVEPPHIIIEHRATPGRRADDHSNEA